MAYCVQTDIVRQLDEDLLIQLTDDDGIGVVDADILSRAIADGDSEIDVYLASRYAAPLSTAPDIIRKISVDMAIYHLLSRRSPHGVPEDRKSRYESGIRLLRDIAKGLVELGIAPDSDVISGKMKCYAI